MIPRARSFLTRAGSFVPDGQGNLVNAAGFYLMGYGLKNGPPAVVVEWPDRPEHGQHRPNGAEWQCRRRRQHVSANLDANAPLLVGAPGTTNYTSKTSIVTFDNIGNKVKLDVYMSKTAANTWDIAGV